MFQPPYDLVLASGSPRRQQLMQQAGFKFTIRLNAVEETYPKTLDVYQVAPYLAQLKAQSFRGKLAPNELVITADTVVIQAGNVLEKPADKAEAIAMLQALSGDTHEVVTGVCLHTNAKEVVFHDTTSVHFLPLTQVEIESYVTECQPFDKAGSYGVQEWIGMVGVSKLEGSFYNVMGLPLHALYQHLKNF